MTRSRTETTALVRRVLSRGLLAVGGAVAGTAAVWALSATSASADTAAELPDLFGGPDGAAVSAPAFDLPLLGGLPAADQAPALPEVRHVVGGLVDTASRVLPEAPARMDEAAQPIRDFGQQAQQALEDLGKQFAEKFGQAPALPLAGVGQADPGRWPGTGEVGGGGTHEQPPVVLPVSAPATAAAQPAAVAPQHVPVAAGAQDRALADGMSRRGSPLGTPGLPGTPELPAPLSAPAPGGSGHTGTGSPDSPAFAALTGFAAGHAPTTARVLRPVVVHTPATVGAQPGVTPD